MFRRSTTYQKENRTSLLKRVIQGAVIAFLLLCIIFLFMENLRPDPEAMILTFLFVSVAGAVAGVIFYYLASLRQKGGRKKFLTNFLAVFCFLLLFCIAFFLGINGS